MVILTSDGLSSVRLLEEARKFIKNKKTAVIITTASVGFKKNDKNIPKITEELQSLNLTVTCLDIEFQDPSFMLQYDVIEILGGNPFYLLKIIESNNCKGVFMQAAQEKILIGISAGSLVLQKTVQLIAQYSPDMYRESALDEPCGMGIVSIECLPHYTKFLNRFQQFEQRAAAYERQNNCKVIRMDDGQGIFVQNDGSYCFV